MSHTHAKIDWSNAAYNIYREVETTYTNEEIWNNNMNKTIKNLFMNFVQHFISLCWCDSVATDVHIRQFPRGSWLIEHQKKHITNVYFILKW